MRYSVKTIRSRYLSRVAGAALIAGFAAGCSSDTSRFMSANPFSNPFNSQPEQTASVPEGTGYPSRRVQSQPLAPIGSGSSYRPIAAQPLPPIGSVGTTRAAPSPQVSYNQPARSGLTTGSVSANSPRVGGFAKGGWSAVGGTVIAAQEGETVRTLSNRYGVPAEAIMADNALCRPPLQAGRTE